jgi:membrane protein DedA with SNARE-associated domain
MNDALQFLIRHDVAFLFAAVFADQIGFPLPVVPWLLAAGAAMVTGQISLLAAFSATMLGALLADLIWFYLGRRYGNRALRLLCRISSDPDACARRTQNLFTKYGMEGVVAAKFIPVMKTLAPALAGSSGVSAWRFLFFDGLGTLLYGGVFILAGYLFSDQVDQFISVLTRHGGKALGLVVGLVVVYIAYKSFQRYRLLSKPRLAGTTVHELHPKLETGERPMILDDGLTPHSNRTLR